MDWTIESEWFLHAGAIQWQNRLDWPKHQILQPLITDWVLNHEYRGNIRNEEEKQGWCLYEWKTRTDAIRE